MLQGIAGELHILPYSEVHTNKTNILQNLYKVKFYKTLTVALMVRFSFVTMTFFLKCIKLFLTAWKVASCHQKPAQMSSMAWILMLTILRSVNIPSITRYIRSIYCPDVRTAHTLWFYKQCMATPCTDFLRSEYISLLSKSRYLCKRPVKKKNSNNDKWARYY